MTMEPRTLPRKDEAAALLLAVLAHVALVAWLMLKPPTPALLPLPERMTVTIANEVADKSTSPDPNAQAAPAIAPVIAENPVPEPAPEPAPAPAPAPKPLPPPPPRPVVKPVPQPAKAQPVKAQPAKVQPQPAKPQPPKPQATKPVPAKPATKPTGKPAGGGGSRIGSDFLKGIPGGQTPGAKANTPPAQAIGPAVKSALSGAITRQLRPKWVAPQGAEADLLVTVLAWDMNADGTLAGVPRVVSQSGITDANRAQAQRHAEQAIRAVRLAAPFDLPPDLYAAWKHVTSFRFDRKLSQ